MTDETIIIDLICRWEELHDQGEPVTPEELCRKSPELLERFRARLAAVRQLDPLLNPTAEHADEQKPYPHVRGSADKDLPVVPGYEIRAEIARGGMGRILAARDLTLDREVAIKVVIPGR